MRSAFIVSELLVCLHSECKGAEMLKLCYKIKMHIFTHFVLYRLLTVDLVN